MSEPIVHPEVPPVCLCPSSATTAGGCPKHGCEEGTDPNWSIDPVWTTNLNISSSPPFAPTHLGHGFFHTKPKADPAPLVVSPAVKEAFEKASKEVGEKFAAFGKALISAGVVTPDPKATDDPLEAKRRADEQRRRRLESLNGPKRGPRNIAPTRHRH